LCRSFPPTACAATPSRSDATTRLRRQWTTGRAPFCILRVPGCPVINHGYSNRCGGVYVYSSLRLTVARLDSARPASSDQVGGQDGGGHTDSQA
jgi:hypothetical protein